MQPVEREAALRAQLEAQNLARKGEAEQVVETFRRHQRIELVHVPYKGSPEQLRAVLSGELHVSTNTPGFGW